jgi:hypothetical protein
MYQQARICDRGEDRDDMSLYDNLVYVNAWEGAKSTVFFAERPWFHNDRGWWIRHMPWMKNGFDTPSCKTRRPTTITLSLLPLRPPSDCLGFGPPRVPMLFRKLSACALQFRRRRHGGSPREGTSLQPTMQGCDHWEHATHSSLLITQEARYNNTNREGGGRNALLVNQVCVPCTITTRVTEVHVRNRKPTRQQRRVSKHFDVRRRQRNGVVKGGSAQYQYHTPDAMSAYDSMMWYAPKFQAKS